MKQKISVFLLGIALFSGAVSLNAQVKTNSDHSANFSSYKTYSWLKVQSGDLLWDDRIKLDVDSQLAANGWTKVDSIREVAADEFVMCERTAAPDCHDLIFGMMRDSSVVPTVHQTVGEMPTLISLVASGMGIVILPASAVKHSGAAVAACEIADVIAMSEIGLAVSKRNRRPIVEAFRSFALKE